MRTFTKVLLIVFWLLGAGSGFTVLDSPPADTPAQYRYAVAEGVAVSVQEHHVTLRIEHRAVPRAVALTVAVPAWVAAWSRSEQALTASSSRTAPPDDNS